jgi:hypothetical protein
MIKTCDRVEYILWLRQYWVLLVFPDDPSGGMRSVTGVVRGLIAGVGWSRMILAFGQIVKHGRYT